MLRQSPAWQARRALLERPELLAEPSGQADGMAVGHGGPVHRRNSRPEAPRREEPKSLPKILPVKLTREAVLPEELLSLKVPGVERRTSQALRKPPTCKLEETLEAAADLAAVKAEEPADSPAEAELAAALAVKPSGIPAGWAAALPTDAASMCMLEMILMMARLAQEAAVLPRIQDTRVRLLVVLAGANLQIERAKVRLLAVLEEANLQIELTEVRLSAVLVEANLQIEPAEVRLLVVPEEVKLLIRHAKAHLLAALAEAGLLVQQERYRQRIQLQEEAAAGVGRAHPRRNPGSREAVLILQRALPLRVQILYQRSGVPARSGRNRLRNLRPPELQKEEGRLRRPARQEADTVPIREIPAVSGTEAPAQPGGNCPEAQSPGEGFKKMVLPKFTPA